MSKRAFSQFYKANLDRIYRYVLFRVGRNQALAEDLVSEIFMKALKNFHKFDPNISQSAWIYRIARNHLANHFRDSKPEADIDDIAFVLAGDDGRETFAQTGDQIRLHEALDQLAPQERKLVTMKHLEGYSYKDMAAILEKSTASLKMATSRAMKKLNVWFSSNDN